jgi:Arc/MetJ family transcription regulator
MGGLWLVNQRYGKLISNLPDKDLRLDSNRLQRTNIETISPDEGLRATGVTAETLSAKRGTVRFAVTAAVFSVA